MLCKIDTNQLINKVRELAQVNPDFVYINTSDGNRCKYTRGDNCPGCIMGQAILSLEPECRPFLEEVDTRRSDNSISQILRECKTEMTTKQSVWLVKVQIIQDTRGKWSDCIKEADEFIKENNE